MVLQRFANPPLRALPWQHEASRRNRRNGLASLRYPFPLLLAVQHINHFAR
jgi:hypothetical protein